MTAAGAPQVQVLLGFGTTPALANVFVLGSSPLAGNMLTANQASIETDASGWQGTGNCTLSQSTAEAHDGTHSLLLTSSAFGNMSAELTPFHCLSPVVPGQQYTASAFFWPGSTTRNVLIAIRWYNASGANLGLDSSAPLVSEVASTWTLSTVTATAPAGAASADVFVGVRTPAAGGELHYLDTISFGSAAVLAGPTTMIDVSAYLSGTIACTRGRSREVDAFQAGSCSFSLRNEDRRFDPTNTSSPYYPGIVPRAPVELFLDGNQIFGGYVDDYTVSYTMPSSTQVDVAALDGFTLLANAKLSNAVFPQQSSGQRVSAVLARGEVAYPASSSIDTGVQQLQGSTQDQVAALDHLQTAADSEAGLLFVDRFGTLNFHDHNFIPLAVATAAPTGGLLTVTDTGSAPSGEPYGYQDLKLASAAVLLFNRVEGSRTGGVKQTADNLVSQAAYSIRTLSLRSTENAADADVLSLCGLLLGRYATPEVHFDSVVVELAGLSPEQQAFIGQVDLGSIITVARTPPGSGSPATISQLSMIEGLDWSFDVSSSKYIVTLDLMNATVWSALILDNTRGYGTVDVNKLGW